MEGLLWLVLSNIGGSRVVAPSPSLCIYQSAFSREGERASLPAVPGRLHHGEHLHSLFPSPPPSGGLATALPPSFNLFRVGNPGPWATLHPLAPASGEKYVEYLLPS